MALALFDVKYSTETLPPSEAPAVAGARRMVTRPTCPRRRLGRAAQLDHAGCVVVHDRERGRRPRGHLGRVQRRPADEGRDSCSVTLRLPSRIALLRIVTSNLAVAMFWANDRLPTTG